MGLGTTLARALPRDQAWRLAELREALPRERPAPPAQAAREQATTARDAPQGAPEGREAHGEAPAPTAAAQTREEVDAHLRRAQRERLAVRAQGWEGTVYSFGHGPSSARTRLVLETAAGRVRVDLQYVARVEVLDARAVRAREELRALLEAEEKSLVKLTTYKGPVFGAIIGLHAGGVFVRRLDGEREGASFGAIIGIQVIGPWPRDVVARRAPHGE